MSLKDDEAKRFDMDRVEVTITAQTFWLELGHLRKLLASVTDLPDNASVTFTGVQNDYIYVDELTCKTVKVRASEPKKRN